MLSLIASSMADLQTTVSDGAAQAWSVLVGSPLLLAGVIMGVVSAVARQLIKAALWVALAVFGLMLLTDPDVFQRAVAQVASAWNWLGEFLEWH